MPKRQVAAQLSLDVKTVRRYEAEERRALLPAPGEPYDVPLWCEPKAARDHFAQVAKAL